MQDNELYRRILGIEAHWRVEHVELQLKDRKIHVYLEHGDVGSGRVPSAERDTGCTIIRRIGGVIWTPARTRRRRGLSAGSTGCGW